MNEASRCIMFKKTQDTERPEGVAQALRVQLQAFEEEADRQLKQHYPTHTRQEHWNSLTCLDWRKHKYDIRLPPSRWSEEIQLGTHGQLSFYLRAPRRLLHYRSTPTLLSGSEASDDLPTSMRLHTERTRDDMSDDSTSTDSSLTESDDEDEGDDEDDEYACGQIMIQVEFPKAHASSTGRAFAQLGLVTARDKTHEEWPTGYHLAVNLDDEYKPAAVWFLSTKPRKSARNTYVSTSGGGGMRRFAAAQVASSLDEMNKLHASELIFTNFQKEYTLVD
jgi:hypothetical protein